MNAKAVNGYVGIRFLLDGGHAVEAVIGEVEANRIMAELAAGTARGIISGFDAVVKRNWAVESSRLLGFVSFDATEAIAKIGAQAPRGPIGKVFPGSSGIN